MTNEKLAEIIAEGDSEELLPILWEKMRRFYKILCDKYYRKHKDRCIQCGVTVDDLMQESYFVMLEGIQAYGNRKPEQADFKFTTFCTYPFKNHAKALIGMKTQQSRNEPLNDISRISLDECLESSDGSESDNKIGDIIPDTAAELPFKAIENKSFSSVVRQAVQYELSDNATALNIIEAHYYSEKTFEEISKTLELTRSRIQQINDSALRRLRKSRALQELYYGNPYRTVSATAQQRDGSVVEQLVERRYELEQRRLKNRYENYFSQLSEAALKKDYEIMLKLDVEQFDNRIMLEALITVMRSRQLLNS